MPAVSLVFAIHQPYLLRRYSIFDAAPLYLDDAATARAVSHAAKVSYLPVLKTLLAAAKKAPKHFRVALSVTGTAMELLERHAPTVIHHLHALHATHCCEFLGETYYGSLAGLYSQAEFVEQVRLQSQMIKRDFGVQPRVFRNSELIYTNELARAVGNLGFEGVLIEGVDSVLASRSPAFIHSAVGDPRVRLLIRHRQFSDAVGRRFADTTMAPPLDFPVTGAKFATAVGDIGGQICNLFFDIESFGLWQPKTSGVLDFLTGLPAALTVAHCDLVTPSEAIGRLATAGELDIPQLTSWCGPARDGTAWLGNAMQKNAQQDLYQLEGPIKSGGDRHLLADFRALTAADHAWFMSTRHCPDEPRRPSPFESPYDAYINFMNVLDNMKARARV